MGLNFFKKSAAVGIILLDKDAATLADNFGKGAAFFLSCFGQGHATTNA